MRLRAFAKLNLDLRVWPPRPDGYHDISTTFQALALHDLVTVEERPGDLSVTCDDVRVPGGEGNLCGRAVRALWEACGRPGMPGGLAVHVEKRVPMNAGLGGGSSDAAATLLALARLWAMDASDPRVRRAAAAVGADVGFFLVGGTALGVGRGDELTPLRDLPPLEVVLVQPPFGVSTAAAYRWFDELQGAGHGGPAATSATGLAVSACRNDLEPPVALRHPEIRDLVVRLRASGARMAAMSGSGSVVFGLFDRANDADRVAEAMRGGDLGVWRTRCLGRAASSGEAVFC